MNGLVFAEVSKRRHEKTKAWFLTLAQRCVERLGYAGFPICADGLLASQASWCQSLAGWQGTFCSSSREQTVA